MCVGCRNQQQSATGLTSSLAFAFLFLSVRSTVGSGSGSLIFVFVGFLMIVWIFFLFFAFAYKKRHFIRRLKVVLEKWSFSFLICTRFFWSFLHVFLCPRVFLHLLYFFLRVFLLLYPFRCLQYFLAFLVFFSRIFPCSVWRIYLNSIASKTKVEISQTPRHSSNHQPLWPSST